MNKTFRALFSSLLLLSMFAATVPYAGYAQSVSETAVVGGLQKGLSAIDLKADARRKELGIPGMSLVIVKDDQIMFAKGFGYKDFEKKVPVTPDTEFAIGSATKAFTALSALMSQDEGKLSLRGFAKKAAAVL